HAVHTRSVRGSNPCAATNCNSRLPRNWESFLLSATDKWNIKYSASYHVEFLISSKKIHVKINFNSFHTFLDTAIFK
ncbi:hypothetical protein, partial [Phascolarctobacterium succinatutens]|uniref:hypothetical protein n=1 Tax=Phascolarctobacterium succinatutens TaxID=626940 RepID=UPI0026ED6264